ncbi:rhomboid family intramembrane serine protease [Pseudoalteromonas sp. SSM20]|uniref:rhomboid family intramembrane serine protease n=1 Tax=Pseudoalteromonas sp. SSM20 TaxID=3139394 RepID=UPI003BAD5487
MRPTIDMLIKQPLHIICILLVILFGVQILNTITAGLVSNFGIYPRYINGLIGIPLAPFIHHSWQHLLSNAAPLAVLAFIVLQQGVKRFIWVCLFITFSAGSAVWLFASEGFHAGASTLVFGLIGFIICNAIFSRNIFNLMLAAIICFLYASVIYSLTQFVPGVSWSSHFFGFIAGCIAGKLFLSKQQKS